MAFSLKRLHFDLLKFSAVVVQNLEENMQKTVCTKYYITQTDFQTVSCVPFTLIQNKI